MDCDILEIKPVPRSAQFSSDQPVLDIYYAYLECESKRLKVVVSVSTSQIEGDDIDGKIVRALRTKLNTGWVPKDLESIRFEFA